MSGFVIAKHSRTRWHELRTIQENVRIFSDVTFKADTAAARGDDVKTAIKNQTNVASDMTAAQIAKAQEMAQRCQDSKFKECD